MLLSPVHPSRKNARQPTDHANNFDPVGCVLFTHPFDHPSTCGLPLHQFTQVRAHFTGPPMPYIHGGQSIVPIDQQTLNRVQFSYLAHGRRFREHGQDPNLRPPTLLMEGVQIDMCYVDMWVRTSAVANRMMFLLFVERLTPEKVRGDEEHGLLQWDIVCPQCEQAITHYVFDDLWNGRYLDHLRNSECKVQERIPKMKSGEGSHKRSGHGSHGGERRINQ
ncbi:hypothetical protein HYPSUDRAFT_59587 [Hypholoma sublateritium FD-334 SS-4]|uniref:Uncharacterized protein n=1 Tax=Hypholoma sublateritium (strain FD-334 SS-4) TaxID=945553 RepID=A0A0D2N480_HYPSF|nr:hypothetical protein HYPSUDRAFT_59587 [Hypholoma sublateritium FD-334 SS-4]